MVWGAEGLYACALYGLIVFSCRRHCSPYTRAWVILAGQTDDRGRQQTLVIGNERPIASRRPRLTENTASMTFGEPRE